MFKKIVEGFIICVIGLIFIMATSFLSSSPDQSYFFAISMAIIYLAAIVYITRK